MTDQLVCEWCGVGFDQPHRKGTVPRYCSNAHRQRGFEQRKLIGLLADKDDEIARL
jgi:hypothetical protein